MLPEVRFKFGRSNSHSHGARAIRSPQDAVILQESTSICHKSLPDLHSSSNNRRRASLSPRSRRSQRPSSNSSNNNSNNNNSQIAPAPQTPVTPPAPTTTIICPDCESSSDYSVGSFHRDSARYRSSRRFRRSPAGSGAGDASSVLSSGGRTHKSSGSSRLSHGPTARDSGGSSGHCTHRSEPPSRIQVLTIFYNYFF